MTAFGSASRLRRSFLTRAWAASVLFAAVAPLASSRSALADDEPVENLGNPKPTRQTVVPDPPPSPRVLPQPDASFEFRTPTAYPTLPWMLTQLIPSPAVGFGSVHRTGTDGIQHDTTQYAFGFRWQVTPLLYSWGVNRHATHWRTFVVDPLARSSGSIELNTTVEYFFGHIDRFLVRPGVRATLPLLQKGEYLSGSLGTSIYAFNNVPHIAYDFGAYVLWGLLGVQFTYAPAHAPLSYMATIRIRYF